MAKPEPVLVQSEQIIAAIVRYLAEQGVKRQDFSLEDLNLPGHVDDDLFGDALLWLEGEGIVRNTVTHEFYLGQNGRTMASGFTLTSLGFSLLNEKIDGDLTLGSAIKQTSESGQGYANVGQLIGGLLGSFTKSVSG